MRHRRGWRHGHGEWRRGASLHRRLFLWFGLSILIMGIVAGAAVYAVSPSGRPWSSEVARVRTFAAARFAAVWSEPRARDELAAAVARDFDVAISVRDVSGRVLSDAGGACERPDFVVPVVDGDRALGEVRACAHGHRHGAPGPVFFALAAAGATLWAASLVLARRLGRPLRHLARVAERIGQGQLSSRAELGRHQPGEVGVLADALNDMAARIEKQLADQRELVAAVSHEIRAPLARLRVIVELLRDGGTDPATLAKLDREILEIDSLVGDLLASSRLDFSLVAWRALDARELAAEALERAGLPAERLVARAADPAFEGDATLVARALANLLDNAARHAGGATALVVRDEGDGALAFVVEDDGPGFSPDVLPRAFEPFQRGHVERRGSTSLGLGLALVRRIAEAHGGTAFAENRKGGGARVAFVVSRRRPSTSQAAP
jgi:signal transduction histidine kinase